MCRETKRKLWLTGSIFFLSRSLGPMLWFKRSIPLSQDHSPTLDLISRTWFSCSPHMLVLKLSKIIVKKYTWPAANSAFRFPCCICHFTSYKRIGYSGWPWKVSRGTEEESGWSFSGLVSVVWVCCSVFMHAANVGHTRNCSGNLRRLVVSFLQIQSVRTPDSLAARMHLLLSMHNVLISNRWIDNLDSSDYSQ